MYADRWNLPWIDKYYTVVCHYALAVEFCAARRDIFCCQLTKAASGYMKTINLSE